MPERPYFYEHLTGEELLHYFGALSGLSRASVNGHIPDVLAAVGMSDARKVELKRYSKGMLQRIGIAQAILHDPQFLVLDEPMSGLDPLGRKEMRDLILRLAGQGRTIFFSTHVIPDVEAICDQVALIQKGRLLGCGPIGRFLARGPLQTEVAFSGIPFEEARKWKEFETIREIPDGLRGMVRDQAGVTAVLEKAIQRQARILWVAPQRPSLEELFTAGGVP